MHEKHILEQNLRSLRLPGILESLELRVQEANENNLGYFDFVHLLIQDERSMRDNNQITKLIRQANFGTAKTFEGFDFHFNREKVPEKLVRDFGTCRFLDLGRNIVLSGPPGIGKSHLAKAIGIEACRRKKHVYYTNIYDIFSTLDKARTDNHFERLFRKISKPDLLILDDFGLRKFTVKEVEVLYQIIESRSETSSCILTSNRPPEDWMGVFPDPVVGGAILDRLVSGAYKIMITDAKSYRKEGKIQEDQADNILNR